ncbi:stage III sporulation protein AA [Scopulibacillus daqui]|uniref:Stage III sporulation protein AA n=1 Tax=Scopulibacillus daqui TaxID=1469162 RepID=A0ABS2Q206_9BACL|nr:stage III sporulation protein AA [Scopulibacillus daqui]MBM7646333.1 stage III sporulation protein AA [Scopulibacillus daqui]
MNEVIRLLPKTVKECIQKLPEHKKDLIEEIRLRVQRPIELLIEGSPYTLNNQVIFSAQEARELIDRLSEFSLYTLEEELRRGYVTIKGGHRVGLAGRVITQKGQVKMIRDISSFNIRIAHQQIGAAVPLIPYLYNRGRWLSTLVIGAPQTGKTTMLRDLARLISQGVRNRQIFSRKVGIVDERSEIAGCVKGIPQNELGHRVDVLDACPKAEGMMMMIRSMSPEVLIVDEIGRKEDAEALQEALNAGISVIATVHGSSLDDLIKRPTLKSLLEGCIFQRFVELTRDKRAGRIRRVLNENGKSIRLIGEAT